MSVSWWYRSARHARYAEQHYSESRPTHAFVFSCFTIASFNLRWTLAFETSIKIPWKVVCRERLRFMISLSMKMARDSFFFFLCIRHGRGISLIGRSQLACCRGSRGHDMLASFQLLRHATRMQSAAEIPVSSRVLSKFRWKCDENTFSPYENTWRLRGVGR